MAIKYNIQKFPTGAVAKALAQNGGAHIYSVTVTEDTPNGVFIGKGDFVELDHYKAKAAGEVAGAIVAKASNGNYYVEVVTPGNALFVYQVPMIEETYNNNFKKESNYTNAPKQVVRTYELAVGDIVEISVDGFDGAVAVNDNVELKAIAGVTAAKRLAKKSI